MLNFVGTQRSPGQKARTITRLNTVVKASEMFARKDDPLSLGSTLSKAVEMTGSGKMAALVSKSHFAPVNAVGK